MKVIKALGALLKAIGKQFLGISGSPNVWRAYTTSGKTVVIQGNRVVDVVDPFKVPVIVPSQIGLNKK